MTAKSKADILDIDRIIKTRRTAKCLSDTPLAADLDRSVVEEIIDCAGWGPVHLTASRVHRENRVLNSWFPWRYYVLDCAVCHSLREILISQGDQTKIPQMLAAASALIQVTWLPDPLQNTDDGQLYAPTLDNMEHIAASAAAVQNMLLAATARDIPSYWSSGGVLRSAEIFSWLDIPETEILLGSIFLFSKPTADTTVVPGKLRTKRGVTREWVRWVRLY